jgi:hypothetical protein
VAAGHVLGGRYGLRRRLDAQFQAERWLAEDDTLARPVEVCVLPSDHPRAEAVVDAARQASLVTDQRLVRVLDVGSEDGLTYVVTEWVDGETLTELVRHGPLVADQARTLLGETALALEQARRRGLHHLLLSSDNVLRLEDGSVKVAGLAVDAALAGLETDDAEEASRQDTFGLAAIAYAALTGFWPATSPFHHAYELGTSSLPQAPDVAGAPVAPAQIVSGVPADLDLLCVQAFAGSGAPDTPGDLAGQIAPWGDRVRQERPTGAFPLSLPPLRHDGDQPGFRTPPPPLPAAPAPAPAPPSPTTQPPTTQAPTTQASTTQGLSAPAPEPVPAAAASAGDPTTPPETASLPRVPAAEPDLDEASWGGLFDDPHREQPAPLLPPTPLSRPPGNQTRTVLILVGIFVVIMLALAKCGLSGLGDNAFVDHPRSSSTPSGTTGPSPSATTGTPSTPTDTQTAGTPISIAAVDSFDPQGDDEEKQPLADKAVDGDPATDWTSDAYKSASFSGLKKGVGLRLDLGSTTTVHEVKVTVPASGTDLQLRAGEDLDGSDVVATADDLDGTVTLTPSSPVKARYLILWFTKATQDKDGYRVAVSEVSVS